MGDEKQMNCNNNVGRTSTITGLMNEQNDNDDENNNNNMMTNIER